MEIILRALREELVLSIVVMDTVAEEYPFGIHHKFLPLFALAVTLVVGYDPLKGFPYSKVVFEVLAEEDIPSAFSCLTQMVDIGFLVKCK